MDLKTLDNIFNLIKHKGGYDYPLLYKLLYRHDLLSKEDKIIKEFLNFDGVDFDICKLPDNLTFKKTLNLEHTNILKLPENLSIESPASLYLNNTKISKFPNNFKFIGNTLDISYTNITSLPENMIIGGDLLIGNTKIYKLPRKINVADTIYLHKTPISNELMDYDNFHKRVNMIEEIKTHTGCKNIVYR